MADIEAIERVPITDRLAGLNSTFDILRRAAERSPLTAALAFIPDGDPSAAAVETCESKRMRTHAVTSDSVRCPRNSTMVDNQWYLGFRRGKLQAERVFECQLPRARQFKSVGFTPRQKLAMAA